MAYNIQLPLFGTKEKRCKLLILQRFLSFCIATGGERGIRTPGPLTVNGFQDRRNRPLCQLSAAKVRLETLISKPI